VELADHGQMLALDPPLGTQGEEEATIGGIIATGDSGPLRHRYGGPRDLVLGIVVALSDGTVARAGGKVIKNVAGYDLAKLFVGSWGTIGLVVEVSLRLQPLLRQHATARGRFTQAGPLTRAARRLAAQPLEADCLDVTWGADGGSLLVRFAGLRAQVRAHATEAQLQQLDAVTTELIEDDERVWAEVRGRQRRRDGAVVKVTAEIAQLESVLKAAAAQGGAAVSRAGLGLSWISLPEGRDLETAVCALRQAVPGAMMTVLDGAAKVAQPRPAPPRGAAVLMERIKARFDPARIFPTLPELQ
jgi:glycolate oxidase FAD binding subunit